MNDMLMTEVKVEEAAADNPLGLSERRVKVFAEHMRQYVEEEIERYRQEAMSDSRKPKLKSLGWICDGVELTAPITAPIGEQKYRELVIDDVPIPYIRVYYLEGAEYPYQLILDNRIGVDVTFDELLRWARFLANAMAVSAGYSCHGPHGRPLNRHGGRD